MKLLYIQCIPVKYGGGFMIIIDKKAYDAAIKNKSSFVIKPVSVSCS